MYGIDYSTTFKKSYKRCIKRGLPIEELNHVIKVLASGEPLDPKYKDHALTGNFTSYRECHIRPDWLLVYRINQLVELLYLQNTGTHSDIFG
ncbi:MAG: type II toxin-antitoxin system YafQ family toxin [Bacteroidales bacterium]|nr:type II toxin-antitoxin system YafQ family toxin [Bacteroidales bacterium]